VAGTAHARMSDQPRRFVGTNGCSNGGGSNLRTGEHSQSGGRGALVFTKATRGPHFWLARRTQILWPDGVERKFSDDQNSFEASPMRQRVVALAR
jgi:hypothetical protein